MIFADAGGDLPRLQRYRVLVDELRLEQQSWINHWRDIAEHLLPRRGRFLGDAKGQANRGDKRHGSIIDNTGTRALGALAAGMQTGITSPARPWFKLALGNASKAKLPNVIRWLADCEAVLRKIFAGSNVYTSLHGLYRDVGAFGTGAMLLLEDEGKGIRCERLPIGSYMLSCNEQGRVDTFAREYAMTVRQIVEAFGRREDGSIDWSPISPRVKDLWTKGAREVWIDVVQVVTPNDLYRRGSLEAKYARWSSCQYEKGSGDRDSRFLRESGFRSFPLIVARWDVDGEDVYGSGPGMEALGDIRQLQHEQKTKAKGIEKAVDPPIQGPPELRNSVVATLPGRLTTVSNLQQNAIRPIYEVDLQLQPLLLDIAEIQMRIKDTFFATLFRMISDSDRRQVTAEEIRAREQEKLLQLGPVLERLNVETLNPLIERTVEIAAERGLLPRPPREIEGEDWEIEHVSIMAQAQKLAGLGSIERTCGFVANIAKETGDQTVLDAIDTDEAIATYADAAGAPPKILRTPVERQALRAKREQAEQAERTAMVMQAGAKSARDLAAANMDGDNALARLTGGIPQVVEGALP